MREIKFRAWDKANKCWIWEPRWKVCYNDANTELMQFTGLKDKNGKEIYEGDIITGSPYCLEPTKVFWDNKLCGWELQEIKEDCAYCHFIDFSSPNDLGYNPWEIIGNIYENPELMKKEEND